MGYFMNRKRAQCQANTTDSIVLDKAKDQLNKTLDSREIYATSTAVSKLTSNFERERERELILFSAKRILFFRRICSFKAGWASINGTLSQKLLLRVHNPK